ncbi:Uncharacterised protein [Pseudomonas aeruginosa]|nr:Uncharacterised protein [Pseudomonas aeruginosa]
MLRSAARRARQFGERRAAQAPGQRVDPLQRPRRSARQEEVQRLRQAQADQRDHRQGQASAEDEHRAPAPGADQPYREQSAKGRAERVAGGLQAYRQAAPAARGVLAGDHVAAGEDAADTQSGQPAQQRQLPGRLAQRRGEHAQARQRQAGEDQRAAPPAVGPGRDEQRAGGHAEKAGAEQQADLGAAQVPFGGHRGCGEGHHQHVEAIDQVEHDAHSHRQPLERPHRFVVESAAQVPVHGRPSPSGQERSDGRRERGAGMQESIIGKTLFLVVVGTASAGTLAPLRRCRNPIGSI